MLIYENYQKLLKRPNLLHEPYRHITKTTQSGNTAAEGEGGRGGGFS
jgi:hypothetical protein